MAEARLRSSSISATRDTEVRINKDRSTVYIDHYKGDELVAHFTMSRDAWEVFVLSEMAELHG